MNWKEFRPTTLFLARFIGIYLVANLLYGLYVDGYTPHPDPITEWVTNQCSDVLQVLGWETSIYHQVDKPTTVIVYQGKGVVSVYEGCNGVNVAIILLAFLLAFGPVGKTLTWFAGMGLIIIHITNLMRILLLFWVTLELPRLVYFTHKYLFTAIIYAVVFVLWVVWVRNFATKKP
jgi:exosortase family protein XrtF